MSIFISYCHRDSDFVVQKLVPILRAAGVEVLLDRERFRAGLAVYSQMDSEQDRASRSLILLSPDYLSSGACVHEMSRAVARDPGFQNGVTIPVKIRDCDLPDGLALPNPLYVDLRDASAENAWKLLLNACDANIGVSAPHWLKVRDSLLRLLKGGQSVNLVVLGAPSRKDPAWRSLVEHISSDLMPELGVVNLESGRAAARPGLLREILRACGIQCKLPPKPEDLVAFDEALSSRDGSFVALVHGDLLSRKEYEADLFHTFRYLIRDSRKLVLLVQTRRPIATLLPQDHPLSGIEMIQVQLMGDPA